MKYLVLECHPGYAVVLDEKGAFLKVANMDYAIGQTVEYVVEARSNPARNLRQWASPLAVAACLCLVMLWAWQFLLVPYGSVRITINPDVRLSVNRMDRVIAAEGLNEDGIALLSGYSYRGKTVQQVSDGLADRAVEMGFLNAEGTIHLAFSSQDSQWVQTTRALLSQELQNHMGGKIHVVIDPEEVLDELEDAVEDLFEADWLEDLFEQDDDDEEDDDDD